MQSWAHNSFEVVHADSFRWLLAGIHVLYGAHGAVESDTPFPHALVVGPVDDHEVLLIVLRQVLSEGLHGHADA